MSTDWAYWMGAAAALFGGIKAVPYISEGERGIVLMAGKAKRTKTGEVIVRGPGFRPIVPFVQKIKKLHIQQTVLNFPNFSVTLKNGLTYTFSGYIVFTIRDEPKWIEHLLFVVNDYKELVVVNFERAVQKIMWRMDELELTGVDEKVKKEAAKVLNDNGIDVVLCGISGLSETSVSQSFRGIDYRLNKAMEYTGLLPECVLAAAVGATPVVNAGQCKTEEYVEQPEIAEQDGSS